MLWQTKKLGEVCDVIAGQSPEGQFYNKIEDGLPFYQGKKEFTEKFIGEPTTWTTKITKEAFAGDILMSVRAPVGPVNFATEKICIGRGLAAIRASKEIDKDFLFNFLQMFESEIVGNAGAVFSSISKTQIENIEIPLPPLVEQKRIVKILDEVFEGVRKARGNVEKNLKNSQELFESYLQNIFVNPKWEEKTCGEIATFRNGMNFTRGSKGEEIKIVGVADFQKSFWAPSESLESVVIDGKLNEIDFLKKDDILTVRSNGNPELIGRTLLAGDVVGKVSHSGFTIRIRLNTKEISPIYLCHYLKSQKARKELVASGTGINIKSLNQQALSLLSIPIPPLSEQKAIVKKLDALSGETKKLEAIFLRKIADLDELKKSILKHAFAGEL